MVDSVYRTRSLGIATEGLPDQYADGVAAKVWEVYIGDRKSRTQTYCDFMTNTLQEHGCHEVLDVACGTGVDSVMLLENGFRVTSVDASDKMLKHALKERWNRRKEESFDKWVIEEANWLTLPRDVEKPKNVGFDAVICLGNSFAHLPDFDGDLGDIRMALKNFREMIRPGGILIIDHRNYDYILDTGKTPAKNIYYNSNNVKDICTSVLYVNGRPNLVTMDYVMNMTSSSPSVATVTSSSESQSKNQDRPRTAHTDHFRLSYYPHRLASFTRLLDDVFGENCNHRVYGDFKPVTTEEVAAFYIHVLQRKD